MAKPLLRACVRVSLRLVLIAMNTFFTGGLQCPVNVINGSATQTALPVVQGGLTSYNYNTPLPSQALDFQKALSLGLLQQRFLQNYAFVNSGRFHPRYLRSRANRSASQPNLCVSIEQEILNQLTGGFAVASSSSSSTKEPSPIPEETVEKETSEIAEDYKESTLDDSMHARGIK